MNKLIVAIVVIILVAIGAFFFFKSSPYDFSLNNGENTPNNTASSTDTNTDEVDETPGETAIGKSVENRDIMAYHFGTGDQEILFVGGIHGGYSWNTALVAYELADYLKATPQAIPANVKVTVIPVLNPDGLNKVVGSAGRFAVSDVPKALADTVVGRFNAHTVDLNRNFDCNWQASAKWQNRTVSGGSLAFSEPETKAIKSYIEANRPAGVVVYYSAAGGVYASDCGSGISTETRAIMNAYAGASGYQADDTFDFYETTGDMVNWLAKNNIPAISVLLTNHTDTEWSKNQKGVEAVLKYYAK